MDIYNDAQDVDGYNVEDGVDVAGVELNDDDDANDGNDEGD